MHPHTKEKSEKLQNLPFPPRLLKADTHFHIFTCTVKNTLNVFSQHKQKLWQMERKELEPALVCNKCQFMYKNIRSFPKKPDADLNGPEAGTNAQN